MSRLLSEMLNAHEPAFQISLQNLERAGGSLSNDVRLSSEIIQATQRKLRALGLNPYDTTGAELYAALQERLKQDDIRLLSALRRASNTQDTVATVAHALRTIPISRQCFALKNISAKKLLRKNPPKKAMKQLGYRSIDSMLKHEPIASIYTAAWLSESLAWRKFMVDQYRQLQAADFETRQVTILNPSSSHWQALAQTVVAQKKHNVVSFRELGAIILLPLPDVQPPAASITMLLMALTAWNELRSCSTFLKLYQVKSDFGRIVQKVVDDEPSLPTEIIDQPLTWHIIQRYYARFKNVLNTDIFEPHIQLDDLSWHSIERVLEYLEPSLKFWRGTTYLGLLNDHKPVSLNIIDVAINYCNQLPYSNRLVHYFRYSLWHELLIRYLKHDIVEETILGQLQPVELKEPVLI